jgi:hypothetical protein
MENVELWKAIDDLTRRHEDTKVGRRKGIVNGEE